MDTSLLSLKRQLMLEMSALRERAESLAYTLRDFDLSMSQIFLASPFRLESIQYQ
jgi:hypothetical protein